MSRRVPEPGSRSSQTRSRSAAASSAGVADQRVVGRRDADDRVVHQRLGREALVRRRRARDGDVGGVAEHALEHVLAVADVERELDVGVRGGERAHERRHERLRRRRDRRDPQAAGGGGGRLVRRLAALVQEADHVRRVGLERGAGGGRPDAAPGALEQVAVELSPERRDRRRHRRLRHDELVGGRRHGAAAHDREERGELGESDSHRSRIQPHFIDASKCIRGGGVAWIRGHHPRVRAAAVRGPDPARADGQRLGHGCPAARGRGRRRARDVLGARAAAAGARAGARRARRRDPRVRRQLLPGRDGPRLARARRRARALRRLLPLRRRPRARRARARGRRRSAAGRSSPARRRARRRRPAATS